MSTSTNAMSSPWQSAKPFFASYVYRDVVECARAAATGDRVESAESPKRAREDGDGAARRGAPPERSCGSDAVGGAANSRASDDYAPEHPARACVSALAATRDEPRILPTAPAPK